MSEKQQTQTPEVQPEETRTLTNADVKSDPLFQKVAGELSELKSQIAAEKEAQAKAQEAAELKRMQEAGEYEKAIKLHAEKLERMEAQHKADLLRRDLTTELVKAGAKNEVFLKGAISSYDGETDIAEYVQSLVNSEDHKQFFGQLEQSRQTQPAPRGATPNGSANRTWEQVKAMEASPDPKQRLEAANIIGEYMRTHGKLPTELE